LPPARCCSLSNKVVGLLRAASADGGLKPTSPKP
jgi:hypothetical protein